jgi:hypothetical protein
LGLQVLVWYSRYLSDSNKVFWWWNHYDTMIPLWNSWYTLVAIF